MVAWLVGIAYAWDGPRVPEEALAAVAPDVYAGWVVREEELAALERTIADARAELVEAVDPVQDREAMARSELQVSRVAFARAQFALDAALQEEEAARLGLRLARERGDATEIAGARERIERAVDARNQAQRAVADARRVRARMRREAVEPWPAEDDGVELVDEPELSEAELLRLEAKRDVLAAELERDQAEAAIATGAQLDLQPFEEAVEHARAAAAPPEG
jgi:hypothetical protein